MRGRKPVPDVLKELRGNPGKRRIKGNVKAGAGKPRCPAWIKGEARKEWDRVCKDLEAVRMLSASDRPALTAYCVAWSRWVEAEAKVVQFGAVLVSKRVKKNADGTEEEVPGGFYQSPYLHVANAAMAQMTRLLAEFGLTPSSRARVTPPAGKDDVDPFEALLNGEPCEN